MHCLFSGSCCPHLQSGRLHLFKKKPDTVVVEPERKVAVRWGRETPAPSACPSPGPSQLPRWVPPSIPTGFHFLGGGGMGGRPCRAGRRGQPSGRG